MAENGLPGYLIDAESAVDRAAQEVSIAKGCLVLGAITPGPAAVTARSPIVSAIALLAEALQVLEQAGVPEVVPEVAAEL